MASEGHHADDETMAAERQNGLEPKLSRLTIVVPSGADAPELRIRRDGGIVPREAWGAAITVDPGPHLIDARAPGRKARKIDVTVRPNGDGSTATLAALDADEPEPARAPPVVTASAPGPVAPIPPRPNASTSESGSRQRMAGWVLGGFGLAGVGTGIGIALVGQSKHDEAVATDRAGNLRVAQDMESTANTTKIVGYAILGGGGAFLISGVILLLTAHSPSSFNGSALAFRPWCFSTGGAGAAFTEVW